MANLHDLFAAAHRFGATLSVSPPARVNGELLGDAVTMRLQRGAEGVKGMVPVGVLEDPDLGEAVNRAVDLFLDEAERVWARPEMDI